MKSPATRPIELLWPGGRPPASLDAKAIAAALRTFLRALGLSRSDVVVFFGTDDDLRRLNARFLGKRTPTDVLSWRYQEPRRGTRPVLGELALSLDRIRAQARANGWPMQTETLRLLAHGCAHLAGHDHQTAEQDRVMRTLEERLLAGVGIKGLYPPPNKRPRRRGKAEKHAGASRRRR